MKWWFKPVLLTIVCVEFVGIAVIGFQIYRYRYKLRNVLGEATVVPVQKKYLFTTQSEELKYYYEPNPDEKVVDNESWQPEKSVYTINGDTLNERFDYSHQKPIQTFRIITLGDSFTFGQYVNTKDNWTEKLEVALNEKPICPNIKQYEVINLAERGYDVRYISHRYETRGIKYNPDLIIWLEEGSGFTRLNEFLMPLIQYYQRKLTHQDIENARKHGDWWPAWTKAKSDLHKKYTEAQVTGFIQSYWKDFFRLRGKTPVIITTFSYIPDEDKEKLRLWMNDQKNVYFYDSLPDIHQFNGTLSDGHPSVEGHRMIADTLYTYLNQSKNTFCGFYKSEF